MFEGFVESGVGAIIGFFLAQIVNIAKILLDWYNRPKLVIEPRHEDCLLEPTERHTIYGFSVRNKGRTIATGIRVQLVRITARHEGNKYTLLSENAYDLSPLRGGQKELDFVPLTLFPGASVEINLASRNDSDDGIYEDIIYSSISKT